MPDRRPLLPIRSVPSVHRLTDDQLNEQIDRIKQVRQAAECLTRALADEHVPDDLAGRIMNRFLFGDPAGLPPAEPIEEQQMVKLSPYGPLPPMTIDPAHPLLDTAGFTDLAAVAEHGRRIIVDYAAAEIRPACAGQTAGERAPAVLDAYAVPPSPIGSGPMPDPLPPSDAEFEEFRNVARRQILEAYGNPPELRDAWRETKES